MKWPNMRAFLEKNPKPFWSVRRCETLLRALDMPETLNSRTPTCFFMAGCTAPASRSTFHFKMSARKRRPACVAFEQHIRRKDDKLRDGHCSLISRFENPHRRMR